MEIWLLLCVSNDERNFLPKIVLFVPQIGEGNDGNPKLHGLVHFLDGLVHFLDGKLQWMNNESGKGEDEILLHG